MKSALLLTAGAETPAPNLRLQTGLPSLSAWASELEVQGGAVEPQRGQHPQRHQHQRVGHGLVMAEEEDLGVAGPVVERHRGDDPPEKRRQVRDDLGGGDLPGPDGREHQLDGAVLLALGQDRADRAQRGARNMSSGQRIRKPTAARAAMTTSGSGVCKVVRLNSAA
jgi:hypothetical protein